MRGGVLQRTQGRGGNQGKIVPAKNQNTRNNNGMSTSANHFKFLQNQGEDIQDGSIPNLNKGTPSEEAKKIDHEEREVNEAKQTLVNNPNQLQIGVDPQVFCIVSQV